MPRNGVRRLELDSLLIRGGTLVCMDAARTVARGDLLAADGRIVALGDTVPPALAALPGGRATRTFDAHGAFVLPGFVHAHLHLCQTLFRGFAEQSDLLRWLRESIWPLEAAHTEASLAASARLGACELIAGGVTCVNDMGTVHHTDALASALEASGLRAGATPAPEEARASRVLDDPPVRMHLARTRPARMPAAPGERRPGTALGGVNWTLC